ncbi:alpha/beta hydrolase-fold protein [Pseudoalteromonas luteoviolacea]|uniref:Putative hydrolase of the alpha/beta superfamily n=1 Tax=Pseudoalteromonas luteoviolacea (strain 2ta16) TaxID=1353533 RepID=V4HB48_PSEL2|nr:alpha/beta hydrolase-fold protein [Pseudoalteromonas luteoviolacea]ESP94706.1 putative hydrolase of the alpha/beta superfamily [Pseudoalteromonas luteoviolacea 2ta16]KZN43430.1 hypothetical protein N483_09040 [Pseudoalteromonas luteoviolacea NCIMB 1944]
MQFVWYILFFIAAFCTQASVKPITETPLIVGKTLSISSKYIKETPNFDVYLPSDYHTTSEKRTYPLVVTLDGWLVSEATNGVLSHLGDTASMPQAIIVSIHSHDRFAWGPKLHASYSGWTGDVEGFSQGRSQDMINYLQKELFPFLKSQYRINDFRIFIGASPTAAFGLHTLNAAPKLFNAHFLFAATDVLGLGYTPDTTMIDAIAKSFEKTPDRAGFLYVASAKREAERNPVRYTLAKQLREALAPYSKTFKLKVEHIDDYGHYPMIVPGLLNAIGFVFPRKDWDIGIKFIEFTNNGYQTLTDILAHYQMLSKQVGFEVYPNLNLNNNAACIRAIAQRLRGQGRYGEADELFNYWISHSPSSASAVAGLAVSKELQGEAKEALTLYRKALTLSEPANTRRKEWLTGKIETLTKK